MPHALVASSFRCQSVGVCVTATMLLAGCKLWQESPTEPAAAGRAWLSNLVGQPSEPARSPDFAWLKPESPTADVLPGDELEVTIHDLFELGKPHAWTGRVSPTGHLDVPLLGRVVVTGGDPAQIADSLADRYRAGDILLNPRVQVRQLNQATVSVRIDGEVHRPETVQVPRAESNVHRALVEAGGAKPTAGTHVSITRRHMEDTTGATDGVSARDTTSDTRTGGKLSVAPNHGLEPASQNMLDDVVWFDLDREADRKALRDWRLLDGDAISFHPAVAPVRIVGAVARPGTIKLPAGRQPTVWEIIQLAGGASQPDAACNVTLIRPARNVHGPQRWSSSVESWANADLSQFPNVEPGDTIHVTLSERRPLPRPFGEKASSRGGGATRTETRDHSPETLVAPLTPDPSPQGREGRATDVTTEGGS